MASSLMLACILQLTQARGAELLCSLLLAQSCLLGTAPPIHSPSAGNGANDKLSFVPNREGDSIDFGPGIQAAWLTSSFFLVCIGFSVPFEPVPAGQRRAEANADLRPVASLGGASEPVPAAGELGRFVSVRPAGRQNGRPDHGPLSGTTSRPARPPYSGDAPLPELLSSNGR